jgi:hypothetical protein
VNNENVPERRFRVNDESCLTNSLKITPYFKIQFENSEDVVWFELTYDVLKIRYFVSSRELLGCDAG